MKSPNSVLSSHLPVRVKKRLTDMQGFRAFISVISQQPESIKETKLISYFYKENLI